MIIPGKREPEPDPPQQMRIQWLGEVRADPRVTVGLTGVTRVMRTGKGDRPGKLGGEREDSAVRAESEAKRRAALAAAEYQKEQARLAAGASRCLYCLKAIDTTWMNITGLCTKCSDNVNAYGRTKAEAMARGEDVEGYERALRVAAARDAGVESVGGAVCPRCRVAYPAMARHVCAPFVVSSTQSVSLGEGSIFSSAALLKVQNINLGPTPEQLAAEERVRRRQNAVASRFDTIADDLEGEQQ